MSMSRDKTALTPKYEDKTLDKTLRPKEWNDYIGQIKTKENLRILIEAAKKRKEPIEHVLLYGPPGLGKTTLAYLIAEEMGTNIKISSGPAIERIGDLASILTNLSPGDVFFIDEAHRLNKTIEEILYPAMENNMLDIIIGKGPSARTLQLELPRFTLIAATTRLSLLSGPLRSRFGITFRLGFYIKEEIEEIIRRSAKILEINIEPEAIKVLAESSRFTPRVANRLLKRIRDFAQVKCREKVGPGEVKEALDLLEVDQLGLEATDRKIIETIIDKFDGGPVGLQALAASTSEEKNTIEEVYEPYLMQIGFIARTPKGRIATKFAYRHLNIPHSETNQNNLL